MWGQSLCVTPKPVAQLLSKRTQGPFWWYHVYEIDAADWQISLPFAVLTLAWLSSKILLMRLVDTTAR